MFINSDGMVMNDGAAVVLNGGGVGDLADALHGVRFEPGLMRPYYDDRGVPCVTINTGKWRRDDKGGIVRNAQGQRVPERVSMSVLDARNRLGIDSPVFNATTLRKEEWEYIDRSVVKATRQRLKAWMDLAAANPVGGFDAMSKLTYEYESMSDPGEAVKDMDTLSDARTDNPLFKLRSVPLPITWSGFYFSKRRIAVSRNGGSPLDTTMAEACGRRVAELVERTTIGTETGVTFGTQSTGVVAHDGTSTEYGYTNFPYRVTKTDLHTPTSANPENVIEDVIEMRETMYSNGYFGPFMLYHSTGYDRFLDDDYFRTGGTAVTRTTRERVSSIDGVAGIRRLDFLTSGYQLIMVQMTPEVAQAINGTDITTIQWESQGGWRINFRVFCIKVPLLKAPYNGVAGILHATTS